MTGSTSPSPTAGTAGGHNSREPGAQNVDSYAAHGTSNLDSGLLRQDDLSASTSRGHAPTGRPRSSEEDRTKVRFSEDESSRMGKNSLASDDISPVTGAQELKPDTKSTDTTAHGVKNPGSSSSDQIPPTTGAASKTSAQMSPRGRTRGMSLRSSLFAKNIGMGQRAQDVDNAIIEMGDVISPMAEEEPRPETAKSKGEASITVSPIARGSTLSP